MKSVYYFHILVKLNPQINTQYMFHYYHKKHIKDYIIHIFLLYYLHKTLFHIHSQANLRYFYIISLYMMCNYLQSQYIINTYFHKVNNIPAYLDNTQFYSYNLEDFLNQRPSKYNNYSNRKFHKHNHIYILNNLPFRRYNIHPYIHKEGQILQNLYIQYNFLQNFHKFHIQNYIFRIQYFNLLSNILPYKHIFMISLLFLNRNIQYNFPLYQHKLDI